MKRGAASIIGWCGVLAILAAYALLSFEIFGPHDVWYQALNAVGAVLIILETYSKKDWQPMTLNIVWLVVAIAALVRSF